MDLEIIQPILDWITNHPDLSGLIVFLVAAGESLALVGIVVPGVVFMLSIGTLVGLGALNLLDTLIWAALGAIAGDWISYWLGRHFDQQLRHVWPLSRYPKLIPKGEKFFIRHGGKSILFGRFVGPLRPIIPAVAGIMHMSQPKFYFMNILSAVLWAPVVILPGVAFGESLQLAQEVFGKLIILIVVSILIAALFGYIAKKLFAYTLMTTVNTWGEFFGFDRAKENLMSFTLVGSLTLLVIFFVSQYEYRYQSVVADSEVVNTQWWEKNWQRFSPMAEKFRSDFPVNVQWWGELDDIKELLMQQGWNTTEKITLRNSLNYFLPDPDISTLPYRANTLFDAKEVLVMIKPGEANQQFSVIRLWAPRPPYILQDAQLWVGSIYDVNFLSPFDLMHIPVRDKNYYNSIKKFIASFTSTKNNLVIRLNYYENVGFNDNWNGEVLLVDFVGRS